MLSRFMHLLVFHLQYQILVIYLMVVVGLLMLIICKPITFIKVVTLKIILVIFI